MNNASKSLHSVSLQQPADRLLYSKAELYFSIWARIFAKINDEQRIDVAPAAMRQRENERDRKIERKKSREKNVGYILLLDLTVSTLLNLENGDQSLFWNPTIILENLWRCGWRPWKSYAFQPRA